MTAASTPNPSGCPRLAPCGQLSGLLDDLLSGDPTDRQTSEQVAADAVMDRVFARLPVGAALLTDRDAQLTWFLLAELDGHGVQGVDDRWSDHPAIAKLRGRLGDALAAAISDRIGPVDACSAAELPARVRHELSTADSPPLARHLRTRGTVEQYRELLRHRSIYHLREADPHTTAIPRLRGRAKAGLIEIQSDEYGAGRYERMHSTLFGRSMRALDLCSDYAAYAGQLPAVTLAWSNALTFFASRRSRRAAVVGNLLALECTSSIPNKRYAQGLRRLGFGDDATGFFDEHVEADAVHEQIAIHDMAVPLVAAEPELATDLITGFRAALLLDADVARHLLGNWCSGAERDVSASSA